VEEAWRGPVDLLQSTLCVLLEDVYRVPKLNTFLTLNLVRLALLKTNVQLGLWEAAQLHFFL